MQSRGTISFRLFGIPISLQPSVWLLLAVIGGLFNANDVDSLQGVLIFVAMGIICLLFHEMGHALVWKALCHANPYIVLGGLGGATGADLLPESRKQDVLITLAGPLCTLIPGLIGAVFLGTQIGSIPSGIEFAFVSSIFGMDAMKLDTVILLGEAIENGQLSPSALGAYNVLFTISVWWCLFNLLPIFPLDGGRLLRTLSDRPRLTYILGIALCICFAVFFLIEGSRFNVLLAAYLGYINWRMLGGLWHKERDDP